MRQDQGGRREVNMTPIEILHKIVDTENEARVIYDEAVSLRDGFDDYVRVHINQLKTEYYQQADTEIEQAEQGFIERADRELKALDEKLEAELADAKAQYESERDAVVMKIFKIAVNADA